MFPELIEDDADDAMPTAPPPEWSSRSVEYQAFADFVAVTKECRALEQRAKELRKQLEEMSYQLRDYLGSTGYQRVGVDDFTVFMRRDLYVRPRTGMSAEAVCSLLKRNGLGHFVKEAYSTSSLTDLVRELEKAHKEDFKSGVLTSLDQLLPPDLARVLNCDAKWSVIAQKHERDRR